MEDPFQPTLEHDSRGGFSTLSIELGDDSGEPLSLGIDDIAEKFVQ